MAKFGSALSRLENFRVLIVLFRAKDIGRQGDRQQDPWKPSVCMRPLLQEVLGRVAQAEAEVIGRGGRDLDHLQYPQTAELEPTRRDHEQRRGHSG